MHSVRESLAVKRVVVLSSTVKLKKRIITYLENVIDNDL